MLKFVLLLLTSMFVLSCDERSKFSTELPTNTAQTNIERARLGIRQIGPEWVFMCRVNNHEDWMTSKDHECADKVIIYEENYTKIILEQDMFPTGKMFSYYIGSEYEGEHPEYFTLSYDYKKGLFLVHYTGPNSVIKDKLNKLQLTSGGFYAPTNEETLKIADEILAILGMSRL